MLGVNNGDCEATRIGEGKGGESAEGRGAPCRLTRKPTLVIRYYFLGTVTEKRRIHLDTPLLS
jgi:hypothetical protein